MNNIDRIVKHRQVSQAISGVTEKTGGIAVLIALRFAIRDQKRCARNAREEFAAMGSDANAYDDGRVVGQNHVNVEGKLRRALAAGGLDCELQMMIEKFLSQD